MNVNKPRRRWWAGLLLFLGGGVLGFIGGFLTNVATLKYEHHISKQQVVSSDVELLSNITNSVHQLTTGGELHRSGPQQEFERSVFVSIPNRGSFPFIVRSVAVVYSTGQTAITRYDRSDSIVAPYSEKKWTFPCNDWVVGPLKAAYVICEYDSPAGGIKQVRCDLDAEILRALDQDAVWCKGMAGK